MDSWIFLTLGYKTVLLYLLCFSEGSILTTGNSFSWPWFPLYKPIMWVFVLFWAFPYFWHYKDTLGFCMFACVFSAPNPRISHFSKGPWYPPPTFFFFKNNIGNHDLSVIWYFSFLFWFSFNVGWPCRTCYLSHTLWRSHLFFHFHLCTVWTLGFVSSCFALSSGTFRIKLLWPSKKGCTFVLVWQNIVFFHGRPNCEENIRN